MVLVDNFFLLNFDSLGFVVAIISLVQDVEAAIHDLCNLLTTTGNLPDYE